MSIDTDTARRVAKLARIRVNEADLPNWPGNCRAFWGSWNN